MNLTEAISFCETKENEKAIFYTEQEKIYPGFLGFLLIGENPYPDFYAPSRKAWPQFIYFEDGMIKNLLSETTNQLDINDRLADDWLVREIDWV